MKKCRLVDAMLAEHAAVGSLLLDKGVRYRYPELLDSYQAMQEALTEFMYDDYTKLRGLLNEA